METVTTMQNDVLVSVSNLSRYYGLHCAVQQISFEVRRGEVLGLLGPNGAGKSTTMLMLTGNIAPSAGQVLINGHNLVQHPRPAKQQLGFLPEHPPLYRELTVREYLTICAKLNRVESAQLQQALEQTLQRCGLKDVSRRLIGNLSKGYQQRVGIAQAIIHNPAVVILDEPTVGLDPLQIREIRLLIRELGGDHSVILSSHILPEIQATCDRVLILHHGEVVLSDSVKNLEQLLHESSLIVGLHQPPNVTELEKITGVQSVQNIDQTRFTIHFTPGQNPAEAIASAAAQHQWRLYELSPAKRSMEQLFVDIITTEPGVDTSNNHSQEHAA